MTKPFKIVVHNDLDGGASAICIINHIREKYGPDAKYSLWFGTYTNVDMFVERLMDTPEQFEKVFIADISVKPELAAQFPDNFILLDHHDTAKALDGINKCIVDTSGNHCGASLCYKHLLKDLGLPYKHLTKLTAVSLDYDLWHHKLPKNIAKNLNFIYYKYWGEKFVERFVNGFDKFNAEEVEFLTQKWKEIKEEIAKAEYVDLLEEEEGYKNKFCMVVLKNEKGEVNELCEHILVDKKFHVAMTVNAKKNKISTRISKEAADKGLHIGEFHASLNIGGGHPQAGGASFRDETHLQEICQALAEKIIELRI